MKKQKIIGVKVIKKEEDLMPILKEGIDRAKEMKINNQTKNHKPENKIVPLVKSNSKTGSPSGEMKINNKIEEKRFIEEMRIKWNDNALSPMNVIKDALKFKNKQFQKQIKEVQEFIEYNVRFERDVDYHRLMDEIKNRFGDNGK